MAGRMRLGLSILSAPSLQVVHVSGRDWADGAAKACFCMQLAALASRRLSACGLRLGSAMASMSTCDVRLHLAWASALERQRSLGCPPRYI